MKKSILHIVAVLMLGTAGAEADELVTPPALAITSQGPYLKWWGLYVGINGGYAWSNSSVTYSPNDPAAALGTCGGVGHGTCIPSTDFHRNGPLAGGQIGYNWQISSMWLVGAEADYQWSDLNGKGISTFTLGGAGNTTMIAHETVQSFGTLRLRIGSIIANPLLLYGTGGLAFGQVRDTLNIGPVGGGALASGGFSYSCAPSSTCFTGSSDKTVWGWTMGAGAEYALTTNITFKTELLYIHLAAPSATAVAPGTVGATAASSFTADFTTVHAAVMRAGVNLRF